MPVAVVLGGIGPGAAPGARNPRYLPIMGAGVLPLVIMLVLGCL